MNVLVNSVKSHTSTEIVQHRNLLDEFVVVVRFQNHLFGSLCVGVYYCKIYVERLTVVWI